MQRPVPETLSHRLMIRILVWREEFMRFGDVDAATRAALAKASKGEDGVHAMRPLHRPYVQAPSSWNGREFASLSAVAHAITGTNWNGHRFLISVTQAFNTASRTGRLTLKVLLTLAQFEREVIGEPSATRRSLRRTCGGKASPERILGFMPLLVYSLLDAVSQQRKGRRP